MFGTAASFAGIQKRVNASMRNWATNSQIRLSTIGIDANSPNRMTSTTTIVLRRSNRSAKAPASGPRTIAGNSRNASPPPSAKFLAAKPLTRDAAVAVIASRPSQSPKLDSDIDSQSLRKSRTRRTARSFATSPTAPSTSAGAPPALSGGGASGVVSDGIGTPGARRMGGASLGGLTVPVGSDESGRFHPAGARIRPSGPGTTFVRVSAADRSGPPGWDPAVYLRYAGERARPFIDLLGRVHAEAPSTVLDLGCGEGTMTATLAERWPSARVTGVDSSPEMLAAAATSAVPGRVEFTAGDVREWAPTGPVDVVMSNAVLHWVPGHDRLLTRWAGWLRPGGWLAVQVPGNFRAPTHALLADLCRSPRWAARLGGAAPPADAVLEPAGYLDVLTAAGLAADVWETTYLHVLTGADPVLAWVRSTVLRPVLALLPEDDAARFTAEYAEALRQAYPVRPDGSTVLPFRRVFAVGARPS